MVHQVALGLVIVNALLLIDSFLFWCCLVHEHERVEDKLILTIAVADILACTVV